MNASIRSQQKQLIFYFQVHQPRRLRGFQYLDVGSHKGYFDDEVNETIMKSVAHDCYVPANTMLLNLLNADPAIKICMSISGEALIQMERFAPEALEGFQQLARTGQVEFFAETFYHSLSSLISPVEFQEQIVQHAEAMMHYFGQRPQILRNTELIYDDITGNIVSSMGYSGLIVSGTGKTGVYAHPDNDLKLLLRDDTLSMSITSKFAGGASMLNPKEVLTAINDDSTQHTLIGFNYESLGEHLYQDAGILNFIRDLLKEISGTTNLKLATATEFVNASNGAPKISIPTLTSWSVDNNISTWLGNDMQLEAFELLKIQGEKMSQVADDALIDTWRSLQASDHFTFMSTNKSTSNLAHDYFNFYPSPYEAFINYMNALNDLALNLQTAPPKADDGEHAKSMEYERQHPKIPVWAMQKELRNRLASELNV